MDAQGSRAAISTPFKIGSLAGKTVVEALQCSDNLSVSLSALRLQIVRSLGVSESNLSDHSCSWS